MVVPPMDSSSNDVMWGLHSAGQWWWYLEGAWLQEGWGTDYSARPLGSLLLENYQGATKHTVWMTRCTAGCFVALLGQVRRATDEICGVCT